VKGRAPRVAPWTVVLTMAASVCAGQQTLYGGNQWLQVSSFNNGLLVTVDPGTGATTPIGKPSGVDRLSGLAFDAAGTLLTVSLPTFLKALAVGADGTVVAAGPQNLFASDVSDFYRIDPATGAATKLGDTGHNPIGALAFGPAAACARDCIQPRLPILPATPARPAPREVERPSP